MNNKVCTVKTKYVYLKKYIENHVALQGQMQETIDEEAKSKKQIHRRDQAILSSKVYIKNYTVGYKKLRNLRVLEGFYPSGILPY